MTQRPHALIDTGSHGPHNPTVPESARAWGRCRCGQVRYQDRTLAEVRIQHRIHLREIRTGVIE